MTARVRLFEPERHLPAALGLGALMVLSALTESVGIVLLVPLLALFDSGAQGFWSTWFAWLGLPLALEPLLALFVALVLARSLINHARQIAGTRLELSLVNRLRERAWDALLHCDWRTAMGLRRSQATNVLIAQVNQAGFVINQIIGAVATLITLGGIALAALAISWQLSLAALGAGALVVLAYRGSRRRALALGELASAVYMRVFTRLDEGLGALRVIKSLGREDQALRDLTGEFAALEETSLAYQRDLSRSRAVLQVGGAVVMAGLVWVAVARLHMPSATLLPMVAMFARSLPLLEQLQQTVLAWANGRAAINGALELIATAEAGREPDTANVTPPQLTRDIALRGVMVHYAGQAQPALAGIDLTVAARSMVALVGPSGAGKSTVADLLGGLLAPDRGGVAIDGQVLAPAQRRAWRSRVAYVQQDPVLLADTVRGNLLWAAPAASEARLLAALDDAAARFVLDLPQGLDTLLGDGGRRLSGGERQRLMLARALLRDPDLLILDEATSALDAENEALVTQAIGRLKGRMTIVVIGHHGALAALADHRIPFDQGKIASP